MGAIKDRTNEKATNTKQIKKLFDELTKDNFLIKIILNAINDEIRSEIIVKLTIINDRKLPVIIK